MSLISSLVQLHMNSLSAALYELYDGPENARIRWLDGLEMEYTSDTEAVVRNKDGTVLLTAKYVNDGDCIRLEIETRYYLC